MHFKPKNRSKVKGQNKSYNVNKCKRTIFISAEADLGQFYYQGQKGAFPADKRSMHRKDVKI